MESPDKGILSIPTKHFRIKTNRTRKTWPQVARLAQKRYAGGVFYGKSSMDKVIHSLYKRAQGDWHKNKAKTLAKSRCRGLSKNELEITPYVTSPFLKFQLSKTFSCGPPFAKMPKMSDFLCLGSLRLRCVRSVVSGTKPFSLNCLIRTFIPSEFQ